MGLGLAVRGRAGERGHGSLDSGGADKAHDAEHWLGLGLGLGLGFMLAKPILPSTRAHGGAVWMETVWVEVGGGGSGVGGR